MESRKISLIDELTRQNKFVQKRKELNAEEPVEKNSVAEIQNNSLLETTSETKLSDQGQQLLKKLENKYKEFFLVGDNLSDKAEIASDFLSEVLTNLGYVIVNKLPDNGLSFAIFASNIIKYTKDLSDLKDPIPHVSERIQLLSAMNMLDIKQTFLDLQKCIVYPQHNYAFKNRAIQCVLLTFAYGKLLQSREFLVNVDNEQFRLLSDLLIPSLQRLAQLGLFAKDAIDIFNDLKKCEGVTVADQEIISETIGIIEAFIQRSKLIAIATDKIQTAIKLVAMESLEKRFSEDALKQLDYFEQLVHHIVPLIMESENPEEVIDKLDRDLAADLTLQSAKLYHDMSRLLSSDKLDRQDIIANLKKSLCDIHENTTLSDYEKCESMKKTIKTVYNNFADALNSQFYIFNKPKSALADMLLKFVKEDFNKYQPQALSRLECK